MEGSRLEIKQLASTIELLQVLYQLKDTAKMEYV